MTTSDHFVFCCPDNIETDLFEELKLTAKNSNIKFNFRRGGLIIADSPGPIIFTGFLVYLMRPYFDEFLKEAGKDHYNILKNIIKRLYDKIRSKNQLRREDGQRFGIRVDIQSPLYSLYFRIPEDKNSSEYENIFNSLFEKVKFYMDRCKEYEQTDVIIPELEKMRANKLVYNDKNGDWDLICSQNSLQKNSLKD
jgi:hypothetical protein